MTVPTIRRAVLLAATLAALFLVAGSGWVHALALGATVGVAYGVGRQEGRES